MNPNRGLWPTDSADLADLTAAVTYLLSVADDEAQPMETVEHATERLRVVHARITDKEHT